MTRLSTIFALVATLCIACGTDPPTNSRATNGDTNGMTSDCEPGERTCQDSRTLATCARSQDGSPRLVTTTCLDTEECRNGDCVERPRDCSDSCTPPETRCIPSGDVETCSDHNGDSCNEFGGARACDDGEVCDPADGLCKESDCTDSCTEGETACEENLLATCSTGAGGCLRFGQGKECPAGETCIDGTCQTSAGCEDECTEGEFVCSAGGNLRECRTDVDADPCTEFTEGTPCSGGDVCRQGECVDENTCQDQCLAGERVCVTNDIATCETNADGCLEFTAPMPCPGANESCQNLGGGNVMCAEVMVSGKVVINEVFYDAVGFDLRPEGSPTFIELYGPPGVSIADHTIELVNGSGGGIYGSFQLPSDALLDGNGYAIVTTDQPDSLMNLLPLLTNVYYILTGASGNQDVIQNGPDNVRLLDGSGVEIDAVGYGDFSGGGVFVGEGSPAVDPVAGRSIGRSPDGMDTDDNSADFVSFVPSPGLKNSDLLINEIYFDQPGFDDGTETFVELIAPIPFWEDLPLDGYVLHAINGFNGDDYIFTGVLPGIDMSGFNLNDGINAGFAVICNIDTSELIASGECTVPYEGVDFQNGPDNFVLRYQGRVVDAVGYGSFSSSETFVGEGSPAPFSSTNAGKSLGRAPVFEADTDDNANDFHLFDPTPGEDNPIP